MEKDYTITKFETIKKPMFILVCNYHAINEVVMYNFYHTSKKRDNYDIGQWIIKYKK